MNQNTVDTLSKRYNINLIPIAIFFSVSLIVNLLLTNLAIVFGTQSIWVTMSIGLIIGQIILFNFVSGLSGRHWLYGFMLGNVLGLIGIKFINLIFEPQQNMARLGVVAPQSIIAELEIPILVFLSSAPFLMARLTRNWRISSSPKPLSSVWIEDGLVTLSVVGWSIALLFTLHLVGSEAFDFRRTLIKGSLFGLISFFSLPAISIAFGKGTFFRRLLYVMAYALFFWILWETLCGSLISIGEGSFEFGIEGLLHSLIAIEIAAIVVFIGIHVLQSSGFQLWSMFNDSDSSKRPSTDCNPTSIDPFTDEADARAIRKEARQEARKKERLDPARLQAYWFAVGMACYTIATGVYIFLKR